MTSNRKDMLLKWHHTLLFCTLQKTTFQLSQDKKQRCLFVFQNVIFNPPPNKKMKVLN